MKNMCKRLTMLLLVFAIVAATASFPITAKAVDLARECSITVHPGDIEEADIVIDLYMVANAEAIAGDDSYNFSFLDAYRSIELSEEPDSDEWLRVSQEAAKIALSDGVPSVQGASCESRIDNLSAGLYLVVARGADLEDYQTTVHDEKGNPKIATKALSSSSIITFSPVLVSLPTKEKENPGDHVINSAYASDWIYHAEITCKPATDKRFGSLEIDCYLEGYNSGNPATFVFDIEAYDDGKSVYSDVVSLTFEERGEQWCVIDGIPVGAEVTVTEVYTGVCYDLVSSPNQTVVVTAEETAAVEFTNRPNDSMLSGGGFTNQFSYVENEYGDYNWAWTEIPHKLIKE